MEFSKNWSTFFKLLFVVEIVGGVTNNCPGPNWIAYNDEKCYKILDSIASYTNAVETCRNLVPSNDLRGCHSPAVVLSLDSVGEKDFIQNQRISENIWIHSDSQLGNLEAHSDSETENSFNCVELEISNNSLHRVACTETRKVICQTIQSVPTFDNHAELKQELLSQKTEIDQLKALVTQLLISSERIANAENSVTSTLQLIQDLKNNCNPTEPIDFKEDKTAQLEAEITGLKSKIQLLETEVTSLKAPVAKSTGDIVEIRSLVSEVQTALSKNQVETSWLKSLSETIKASMGDLNKGLDSLNKLFKSSQAPIEEVRGDVQKLKLRLTAVESPFNQAKVDIESLRGRVGKTELDLISKFGEVKLEISSVRASAVTNLRFDGPQSVAIWRGPGYNDEYGWVITGIHNHNWDKFPDTTSRRRIQKLVNGVWSYV